jgi:hypothetical protein
MLFIGTAISATYNYTTLKEKPEAAKRLSKIK